MCYQKQNIPIKNESLSLTKVNEETIMLCVNGQFKTMICQYDVLQSVLKQVDGVHTYGDIEDLFEDQYGRSAVENFLKVLLDEEFIITKKKKADRLLPKTYLLGSGILLNKMYPIFEKELCITQKSTIEAFLETPEDAFDVALIVPGHLNYKEILNLNRVLVEKSKPFFLVYFNGKELVVGPFVFPWKTACFECHITHHLNALKRSSNQVMAPSALNPLHFSYEIGHQFEDGQLAFIASCVAKDVGKIMLECATFTFLENERMIVPNDYMPVQKKVYKPTTDCACCHGMNKTFTKFEGTLKGVHNTPRQADDRKLQYNSGGFRSVGQEETEQMVKKVLKDLDLKIAIERVYDNPFASIIPVFDSSLKTTHKNKTPYFFEAQKSHGKGINEKQAYFSAAFEIFERLSARYYGEKEILRASVKEVAPYGIDLESYAKQCYNAHTAYEKYDEETPIDWVWGESLITGQPKLVPASMVFLTEAVFKGQFYGGSSSGLSAGATLKDAILQGLFELVEHDAWMIGQANPIPLPQINISTSQNQVLKDAASAILEQGYKIIHRDYTNDIGIPVIRTWITHPNHYTTYATNGFGASVSPELALERSLTEAIQSAEPDLEGAIQYYGKQSAHDLIFSPYSLYSLYYFQQKDIAASAITKDLSAYKMQKYQTAEDVLEDVIGRIQKAIPNCDIVFVNLTREVFGIPVVRVMITGDIQRLNVPLVSVSPRLFEFQKKMGYTQHRPTYAELYMGPYPH